MKYTKMINGIMHTVQLDLNLTVRSIDFSSNFLKLKSARMLTYMYLHENAQE